MSERIVVYSVCAVGHSKDASFVCPIHEIVVDNFLDLAPVILYLSFNKIDSDEYEY